jgi:hypothetical protein
MKMQTKTRKTILAVSFALIAILASALPVAAQSRHYLQMENNTGYDVYRLYFSSANSNRWGDDMLGPVRIFRDGSRFTITGIAPGSYDLKFVDQDNDVCVVRNVTIYQDLSWDLSEGWLVSCEVNTLTASLR